jgi:Tol biopolymer transport system component
MTIRVALADGSGYLDMPRPEGKKMAFSPLWSPDGSRIAFTAANPGSKGIYVSTPDLDSSTRMAINPASDAAGMCLMSPLAAFSPTGLLAYYASEPSGMTLVDPLSGEAISTGDALRDAHATSFSSAGTMVFSAWAPSRLYGSFDSDDGCGIFAFDVETGEKRYLTPGVQPVISPDGSKVAFARDGSLFVVNTIGTGERKLLINQAEYPLGGGVADCAWSADSLRIACGAPDAGEDDSASDDSVTLVVIDVNTGAVTQVGEGSDPSWSPDGNWLAYTLLPGGGPEGSLRSTFGRLMATLMSDS